MLHHAQCSPDAEICGLIGSRDGQPVHCYPVSNTSASPQNRFEMDSREQIKAMALMRDRQEELFAIYHSHPAAPAFPSTTDLDNAAYPEALYLIISLNTKGVLEMRGFKLENRAICEIELCLSEN